MGQNGRMGNCNVVRRGVREVLTDKVERLLQEIFYSEGMHDRYSQ